MHKFLFYDKFIIFLYTLPVHRMALYRVMIADAV